MYVTFLMEIIVNKYAFIKYNFEFQEKCVNLHPKRSSQKADDGNKV